MEDFKLNFNENYLGGGMTIPEILDDFPDLAPEGGRRGPVITFVVAKSEGSKSGAPISGRWPSLFESWALHFRVPRP